MALYSLYLDRFSRDSAVNEGCSGIERNVAFGDLSLRRFLNQNDVISAQALPSSHYFALLKEMYVRCDYCF